MIGFFPRLSRCGMPVFQNDPTPGSLFLMFLGDNGHHQTVTKPFCFKVEISVHGGGLMAFPGGFSASLVQEDERFHGQDSIYLCLQGR